MLKAYKIGRWVVLLALVFAILLALRKPTVPASEMSKEQVEQNVTNFESKLQDLEVARGRGQAGAKAQLSEDEINAVLGKSVAEQLKSQSGPGSAEQAPLKDMKVSFEGNEVRGYFLTEMYGKDVYLTISGHLGARDGYVTLDPTGFKVGDLSIPVSMVNPSLQSKLLDPANRAKLKLPDFVADIRIENGQLVVAEK